MLLEKNVEWQARRLSPVVWDGVPIELCQFDPGVGVFKMYDFTIGGTSNAVAEWTSTVTGTSAAAAVADAAYGALVLTPGNSADNSAQIQHGHGEWFTLAAYPKFVMEARLKVQSVSANKGQMFMGLSVTDTTILASGANSAADHVGIQMLESTALTIASDTNATSPVLTSMTGAIAADTYLQLGLVVTSGLVRAFVNGVPDTVAALTLPSTEMRPSIAGGCGDTSQTLTTVDWVAFCALT